MTLSCMIVAAASRLLRSCRAAFAICVMCALIKTSLLLALKSFVSYRFILCCRCQNVQRQQTYIWFPHTRKSLYAQKTSKWLTIYRFALRNITILRMYNNKNVVAVGVDVVLSSVQLDTTLAIAQGCCRNSCYSCNTYIDARIVYLRIYLT